MNIQQHVRIANIQKLSGYLLIVLTCLSYLIWLAWPLMTTALFFGGEQLTIVLGDAKLKVVELNLFLRCLILAFMSVAFFYLLKGLNQFRDLMRYFKKGDIFNSAAIAHARNALFNGLIVFGVVIAYEVAGWIYKFIKMSTLSITFPSILYGCIFFGLMYLLLWALEIGHDLNEESDLTI